MFQIFIPPGQDLELIYTFHDLYYSHKVASNNDICKIFGISDPSHCPHSIIQCLLFYDSPPPPMQTSYEDAPQPPLLHLLSLDPLECGRHL